MKSTHLHQLTPQTHLLPSTCITDTQLPQCGLHRAHPPNQNQNVEENDGTDGTDGDDTDQPVDEPGYAVPATQVAFTMLIEQQLSSD